MEHFDLSTQPVTDFGGFLPAAPQAQDLNLPLPTVLQQNTIDDYLNLPLSVGEKKDLHKDLLTLPPEKLGEIVFVLKSSQPDKIKQNNDELELDLKKLDTKTLRHLQRYVQSIFAKVRAGLIQPTLAPTTAATCAPSMAMPVYRSAFDHTFIPPPMAPLLSAQKLHLGDLLPTKGRRLRRSYGGAGYHLGRARKRRSSFTDLEKEAMVLFWDKYEWKAIHDEDVLNTTAARIGVSPEQLKVFRQNHRKKHMQKLDKSQSASVSAVTDVIAPAIR